MFMENKPEKFEEPKAEVMTYEEYAEVHHDTPYVFEIESGDKKISYFGAEHSRNPQNPMFEELEQKFLETNPDIVFVEGWNRLEEVKPGIIKGFKKASRENIIKQFGEPGFTMKLAAEAGIDLESPEPKFRDEINHLLERGFGREEIFAFYAYRQIEQYHRTPEKPELEEYLAPFIQKEFSVAAKWKDFDYSVKHLQEIGNKIWGEKGDLNDPRHAEEKNNPTLSDDTKDRQTVVNEIARQSSRYRDECVVERIKEAIKEKDRLFIVFGATHAVMQEPALRKMFSENKKSVEK